MSRTALLFINAFSNVARLAVNAAVFVLLVPVMLHGLGVEHYGVWTLVGSLLGVFQLLDAGFGVGVVRAVGQATGDHDHDRRNRLLSTYLVAYGVLALAGGGGVLALGAVLPDLFALPASLGPQARLVLWLVGLRMVVLALPLSLYRGVLVGQQRLGAVNLVQVVAQAAYGALVAVSLWRGGGLVVVALIGLAMMLVEHAVYVALAYRWTPGLRVSPGLAEFALLKQTLGLCAAQLVIALSGLILLRTDPLLVQWFVGLSGVAAYSIALRVAEQAFLGVKQFVNALSPLVAQLHGQGDTAAQRAMLVTGTKFVMVPAAAAVAVVATLGRSTLALWLGPDLATISPILTVLVLAMMLTVPQEIVFTLFTYTGRHALPGRASLAAAVVNLIASLVLAPALGMLGIALGTLVAVLLVNVGWVLRAACRSYGLGYADYARSALGVPLALAALQAGVTAILVGLRPPASLIEVGAYALPGLVILAGLFWLVGLSAEERHRVNPQRAFRGRLSPATAPVAG